MQHTTNTFRQWSVSGLGILPLPAAAFVMLAAFSVCAQTDAPTNATSEFRRESNGYWLYVDGIRTPALAGAVYQHTDGSRHVREYTDSLYSLYSGLDDTNAGGLGHGDRLEELAIRAIRVYELPVEHPDDVLKTKEIFRRLLAKHHIKVLIGDWAGLHTSMNFQSATELGELHEHLRKLVATYSGEPWVLGWQLGNENNYHLRSGVLGHEIDLDPAAYYSLMDGLAGTVKQELGNRHLKQLVSLGQGDLSTNEADLISRMRNIDAVGINCYREDSGGFEQIIDLADSRFHCPIYFAEVGRPGEGTLTEEQQSQYLQQICTLAFSHEAGGLHSGNVVGVFLHEATDEAWKQFEWGRESDAHYGFLGKTTERVLKDYLRQYADFCVHILPTNDAPDTLIQSAWQCLDGPYVERYPRAYGYALAYAQRAITLYQDPARQQELQLRQEHAPLDRPGDPRDWALNTVGTSYFILGDTWMLLSYDYQGAQEPADTWEALLEKADSRPPRIAVPKPGHPVMATNAAGCLFYAKQVFATLQRDYPHAQLQEADGTYDQLDRAVQTRFPELTPPYLPLTWQGAAIFVGAGLLLVIGLASLCRRSAARTLEKRIVQTESAMSPAMRWLFVVALALNLASLYWFLTWWFHPIRLEYYTVQPVLYWMLSGIGALGILFYFQLWAWLWNMRRPVPRPAQEGRRVAMVTTRVASEPIGPLETTLRKMVSVAYPHDTYLLDEEDSDDAKACCARLKVTHFTRKGMPRYNQHAGRFQAKTKGGNLNSWLYEFGHAYEFVTFLDPDHVPRVEFLDKVLGYFDEPLVAFVQAPQVLNNESVSWVSRGAAEQSYFFYGPIQMGLFGMGSCVVNGSHSTFRVSTLMALPDEGYAVHDADDILTSIRIHAKGQQGVYIPEVIAEGLAPDDWDEFSKQQRRWAYSMFHLLFHFYPRELRGMPWRCKMVYLVMASFYFRGIAFAGLLLLPFLSAVTGNPPVNAHISAFLLRYVPFFFLHFGIMLFLGQRFLVPEGARRGLWYRGGLLWVAMWWEHLRACAKALVTRRVTDRVVAAKWSAGKASRWTAVRPHAVLAIAASLAFAWTISLTSRRETVWGTLVFLGIVLLSQGLIIFMVTTISKQPNQLRKRSAEARPIIVRPVYYQGARKL